jgi:hypothetical protein
VIPEEEIPDGGVVVRRRGSARGRRRRRLGAPVATGRGEGASGLRFDVAEPVKG